MKEADVKLFSTSNREVTLKSRASMSQCCLVCDTESFSFKTWHLLKVHGQCNDIFVMETPFFFQFD